MQEIAGRLADKLKKADCDSSQCSLLVTDFYISATSTSRLGRQLSDEFALRLSNALPKVKLIDRTSYRQLMNRNRIPLEMLNTEHAERWVGRQLGATAVVAGELSFKPGNVAANFKVVDARPKKKKVESLSTMLPKLSFKSEDLEAIEPYPKLDKVTKNDDGEVLPPIGQNGVTSPRCTYMPNPPYTDEARATKLSGVIILEAIVTTRGAVEVMRVVRGLPYGLNEEAIRTMETWRCTPSTKDGRPVSTLVTFEVNFRLY